MPQISPDTISERQPRIGSRARTYTWPLAMRFSSRARELSPDEASALIDFISTEAGLVVRDGFAKLGAGVLDNVPLHLDIFQTRDAIKTCLAFTKTKIYKFVSPNWTDISLGGGYAGTDDNPWDGATVLNNFVATNYVNKIQYWDGVAATFVDLLAAAAGKTLEFTKAKFVLQFGGRLWLLNLKESTGPVIINQLRARWSVDQSFINDADWTSLGSSFADLDSTPDPISGAAKVGSVLVIYKARSLYHVHETFDINSPFYFQLQKSAGTDKGIGLVAGPTLAEIGSFNIGLFNDNVYKYDLTTLAPIGDPVIRDVIARAGVANVSKAFAAVVPQQNWYILFVPLGAQTFPEQGYIYDYRRDLWVGQINKKASSSSVNVPSSDLIWNDATFPWNTATFTSDSLAQAASFPLLIVGNPDSKAIEESNAKNAYVGTALWRTRDEDFGYPDRNTGISRLRVRLDSSRLAGTIGVAISGDGGSTFLTTASAPYLAVLGEQDVMLDVFHYGRRHLLQFSATSKIKIVEWEAVYSIRGKAA